MKNIITLLSICLFIVILFTFAVQAESYRLAEDIIPVEQSIELKMNPHETEYTGKTRIQLEVKNQAESFLFHSENLTINSVSLTKDSKDVPVVFEKFDDTRIKVVPSTMLELGRHLLEIDFSDDFDTQANSLYKMEEEGEAYLYTQMEADEAREAFPCWDEPVFKIPYQLTLIVPESDMAVSNTPIESQQTDDGWTTYVFKKSKPMPSYLIAIAVGPFEFVDIPGMSIPGRVVTPKGKAFLAEQAVISTPPLLTAMEEYFDDPYPYEKLDLIAVPEFWPGAMENPGAITYAEGILLVDGKTVTSQQKLRQASVTAHELAHMWFGDLVTMEWWDDLWLNESFATWMGNKITHQVYPEYELDISRANSADGAMVGDARTSAVQIRQPVTNMSDLLGNIGVVYNKGEAVLSMFELKIGEENFRKGVLDYINNNEWGNATAEDLWEALKTSSGFDVSSALATFVEQPGVPLVTFTQVGDNSFEVSQKRFTNYGKEIDQKMNWHIPLSVKYSSGSSAKTASILLSEKSQSILLPSDGKINWVMPNVDSRGYYRWMISPEMMNKLAGQSVQLMTPRERIGFINNLSALLDAGVISGGDFMEVISSFKDDDNMLVFSTLLGALSKVEFAFITDDLKEKFSTYINTTLKPVMEIVGFTSKESESERTKMLRPSLINWLAYYGKDAAALQFAEEQFNAYMEYPESVDPSIIGIAVGLACIRGDMNLFEECKKRFENATTARERGLFLGALGSFEDPKIQDIALDYCINGPLRPQEFFTIPQGIAQISSERTDYVFQWITDNYELVLRKSPPQYHSYMPYFASGCSAERLEAAKIFFSKEENQRPGTLQLLDRISEQVSDCLSLREREIESVVEYFRKIDTK